MSIAEATIERMPVGAAHRRMFWLLGAGMLIDAFELFMQAGVVASMVHTNFTGTRGVAQFIFATFLGLAIGSVMSGTLADRFGRKSLYQFNLLLFSLATLATAAAPSFMPVVLLRFIAGIGLGGELVVGYAIMAEMTPAYCRGRWGVTLGLLVNCAQPLSAFVGAWFLPVVGWRVMFVVGAIPALVVWYLRRALPESPRWLERQGRIAEMHEVLDALWRENTGAAQAPRVVPTNSAPLPDELPWTALFSRQRLARTLFCFAIVSLILASQYGFIAWVPTLLLHRGQSIVHSLTYSAVMAMGAPIGMLLPIFFVDRLGRRTVVASASFLAAAVGIGYALALDAPAWVLVSTGFLEVMFIQITANTVLAVYLPELFPTDIRGTGFGASTAVGRVSAAIMPYFVLFVLNGFGSFAVFVMLACVLLSLCLLVLAVGPETRRKTLEDVEREILAGMERDTNHKHVKSPAS
ncbi:MFS transporter [Paraburkholderia sp. ZP32-5]|uniref:MFS transporter n=1 Tax=Paraburkholderia sp. ZP32-5 TaxID=2883245 RepID=UPI001F433713|nr:MFS transporter [Paraburkholderia sp. ZP32-5]